MNKIRWVIRVNGSNLAKTGGNFWLALMIFKSQNQNGIIRDGRC